MPAADAYPFQWFWDSCFHAVVWSRFDPARAADELRALLAWQEPDGFVPHVVFWDQDRIAVTRVWHYLESRTAGSRIPFARRPRTSAYIQPPLLAQAVERVADAGPGEPFVAETLPALERYYRYLARARDPDGDGLISTVTQFESGLDFSPAYDRPLVARWPHPAAIFLGARLSELRNKLLRFDLARIFRGDGHQEDVLVNAVYGEGLRALARLALHAGREELASWAQERAGRVTEALLERSLDRRSGLFFNLAGRDERPARTRTILSLLPLVLEDLPREVADRLVGHLTDPREFWAPYPVPSVALDEPSFRRDHRIGGFRFIWRGPTSMNTNWLLVGGLRRHGYADVADTLVERSRELVERGGFNEFYDPLSGEPVGASDFGWATLAVDLG